MSNVNNNHEKNGFSSSRDIQALILNQASLPCDTVSLPNNLVIWGFLFYSPRKFCFKSVLLESKNDLKELIFPWALLWPKIQTLRKILVKGPDEGGPLSCQKADLAGSQGSPLGMESCYSLTQSLPLVLLFLWGEKNLHMRACPPYLLVMVFVPQCSHLCIRENHVGANRTAHKILWLFGC